MSYTHKYLIWTAIALAVAAGSFFVYKRIYSDQPNQQDSPPTGEIGKSMGAY